MTIDRAMPRPRHLPGDLSGRRLVDRMLRVNHAGEYGAVRIYQGQLAVLGRSRQADLLGHMLEQEREHLDTFNRLVVSRRVRPTLLTPLWHVAGFALGAGTALLGERAAMACTVAVEEVIDRHYADQVATLDDDEPELRATFEKFRQEELEHRDIGYANGAERAPGFGLLTGIVKRGSRIAIWLSERL